MGTGAERSGVGLQSERSGAERVGERIGAECSGAVNIKSNILVELCYLID